MGNPMNVFDLRNHLIADYAQYITSFIQIRDPRIGQYAQESLDAGVLWPRPLIQLNPSFEAGESIDELVQAGVLHPECRRIFRKDKDNPAYHGEGRSLRLHKHQSEAVRIAQGGHNYVSDHRHRLGQEPRLHHPHRGPRPPARSGQGHPGHRRLSR